MGSRRPDGWGEAPAWARWTARGYLGLLGYGTAVHVVQLIVGRGDPYPWAPGWLAAYFVLLTVLDPLAAVLLAGRWRVGMDLACLILATDAAANAYALYGLGTGGTAARVGNVVVALLAVGALLARTALSPWLEPDRYGTALRRGTWRR